MQFSHFDIDAFLAQSWQKKPALIKNPWRAWRNPLEPDDLAGLACEEGVESRLVTQGVTQATAPARASWAVEHGPLAEARFGELGEEGWTLLVQAVDHHVPAVAALIEPFRFIPNWRIDDVMVSYAADGGGVGPHVDQYDVFLIQGLGTRRWQVGAVPDTPGAPEAEYSPHDDLRLLANFRAVDEWLLEPGDILYLPPGVAHDGVAVGGDCMTYSIGFRAPSRSELIAHYCDHLLGKMAQDDRYGDPDLNRQENPGEISAQALARLHDMLREKMDDHHAFARWFGQYSSTPKYPDEHWQPDARLSDEDVRALLANDVALSRNPASRFSLIWPREDQLLLFVDGQCFECAGETTTLAEILCAQDRIVVAPALRTSDAAIALIAQLANQGSVALDPDA